LTAPIDPKSEKIGEALNLQQLSILEIEYLKLDLDEAKEILPDRLKKSLDLLLNHSVKTSKILQELNPVPADSVELAPGSK